MVSPFLFAFYPGKNYIRNSIKFRIMANGSDKNKQCPSCREYINVAATKCTHCGSFQNWRRHLNFSSSLLSLMVALISVATVFITVVMNSTTKKNSEIHASIINWQRSFITDGQMYPVLTVELFVSNSGQRPGAVKTIAIRGEGDSQFQFLRSVVSTSNTVYAHDKVESQIVEPGKTLLLKEHLKSSLTVDEFESKYANSDLRVVVVNFDGKEEEIFLKIRNRPPVFYK